MLLSELILKPFELIVEVAEERLKFGRQHLFILVGCNDVFLDFMQLGLRIFLWFAILRGYHFVDILELAHSMVFVPFYALRTEETLVLLTEIFKCVVVTAAFDWCRDGRGFWCDCRRLFVIGWSSFRITMDAGLLTGILHQGRICFLIFCQVKTWRLDFDFWLIRYVFGRHVQIFIVLSVANNQVS